jgi:chaperonin cofactor prefoldin
MSNEEKEHYLALASELEACAARLKEISDEASRELELVAEDDTFGRFIGESLWIDLEQTGHDIARTAACIREALK